MSDLHSGADQRRFPRVEFFLVPDEHEQLPVWVIKPEGLSTARGGVVVNLSEAGLQILASAEPPLDALHYEMRLLLGEDEGVPLFSADVRRVWSRPLSRIVQLCGFEFETPNSEAEEFLLAQTVQITARKWVRCVLVERMTALA
ncbi:PilZ domain-containing protein [Roseateles sp.]|uniref:PilZ domain-containing protein n=1 Tax=Roseateles sp. TaxID=1971397 RepID=UPI0025E327E4|nr:PilZ domain-containing protein [Roseateles sp.]MBV8036812.1 PilZ domain-containing protein [Roseateles sp.]